MTEIIKRELAKALTAFGISGTAKITAKSIGDKVIVNLNGKRFGIYDVCKKTFVD